MEYSLDINDPLVQEAMINLNISSSDLLFQ